MNLMNINEREDEALLLLVFYTFKCWDYIIYVLSCQDKIGVHPNQEKLIINSNRGQITATGASRGSRRVTPGRPEPVKKFSRDSRPQAKRYQGPLFSLLISLRHDLHRDFVT